MMMVYIYISNQYTRLAPRKKVQTDRERPPSLKPS